MNLFSLQLKWSFQTNQKSEPVEFFIAKGLILIVLNENELDEKVITEVNVLTFPFSLLLTVFKSIFFAKKTSTFLLIHVPYSE